MSSERVNSSDRKKKLSVALNRLVNHVLEDDNGEVLAYACNLRLPSEFNASQKQANQIYKKVQADFCKHVSRRTGHTPSYLTIKNEDPEYPRYAMCIFTRKDSGIELADLQKGEEIANGKAIQAGWANGRLDVIQLFKDAPRFKIAHEPIQITQDNKDSVIEQLQHHLQGQSQSTQPHQRTIFVSKCP